MSFPAKILQAAFYATDTGKRAGSCNWLRIETSGSGGHNARYRGSLSAGVSLAEKHSEDRGEVARRLLRPSFSPTELPTLIDALERARKWSLKYKSRTAVLFGSETEA